MTDDKQPTVVIPKLEGDNSNWVMYRDRLVIAIEGRNLDAHLASATITAAYNKSGQNNQEEQDKWRTDNRQAKILILNSLPDVVFNKVKQHTSAKAVWDAVKIACGSRTNMAVVDMRAKLQTTVCHEKGNLRTHFNLLDNYRQKLAALGSEISDTDFASILQSSLPESYHSILGNIATVSESTNKAPTPDIVTKFAFAEYERRVTKGVNQSGEALAMEGRRVPRFNTTNWNTGGYWNGPGAHVNWVGPVRGGAMRGRGGRPFISGRGRGMVPYVNVGARTNYGGGNVVGQHRGVGNRVGVGYSVGQANVTRGSGSGIVNGGRTSWKNPNDLQTVICWNCGGRGHIAACCGSPGGVLAQHALK